MKKVFCSRCGKPMTEGMIYDEIGLKISDGCGAWDIDDTLTLCSECGEEFMKYWRKFYYDGKDFDEFVDLERLVGKAQELSIVSAMLGLDDFDNGGGDEDK